jgi:hypothetical protein
LKHKGKYFTLFNIIETKVLLKKGDLKFEASMHVKAVQGSFELCNSHLCQMLLEEFPGFSLTWSSPLRLHT